MGQKTSGKTLASVCLWKVCIQNSCNWQIYLQNHDLNFRSVLHTNQNCSKIGTGSIHRNSKRKTIQVLSILVHRHSMFISGITYYMQLHIKAMTFCKICASNYSSQLTSVQSITKPHFQRTRKKCLHQCT